MRIVSISLVAAAALVASAALAAPAAADDAKKEAAKAPATAKAAIESRSGSKVTGIATFTETSEGVQVTVDVAGASPGQHAVHLHEKGDCSAPDGTSAGGHFNPTTEEHGAPNATPSHAGDFGNVKVGEDGKGSITMITKKLTVAPGPSSVVGRAVIVHASPDDMKTQPTGNAGGRFGCGVVK